MSFHAFRFLGCRYFVYPRAETVRLGNNQRAFVCDRLGCRFVLELNFAAIALVIRFFAFFNASGILTRNKRGMMRGMRERRLDYIAAVKAFDWIVLCRLCSVGTVRRLVFCYIAVFALVKVCFLISRPFGFEIVNYCLCKRDFTAAGSVRKEFTTFLALTFVILDVSVLTGGNIGMFNAIAFMSCGNDRILDCPRHRTFSVDKLFCTPFAVVLFFQSGHGTGFRLPMICQHDI